MRDRTGSLKFDKNNPFSSTVELQQMDDLESGHVSEAAHDKWMDKFFSEVSDIQQALGKLDSNLPVIERLENKILSCILESEEKAFRSQLQQVTKESSKIASQIHSKLLAMKESAQRSLKEGSADYRMCISQELALSKKFRSSVLRYQQIQQGYKNKQKSRFERQYRIVNPAATSEEIDELLDKEVSSQQIFAQHILSAALMDEAKRVLKDVQIRHDEILQLSKTIIELQKLFEDVGILVTEQDEMMNQIAYQVQSAEVHMGVAKDEMTKAVDTAKSIRRKKWCLCSVLLIVLLIIALVIAFYVVPNWPRWTGQA
ncbi:hypothetical protein MP638_006076 [Amoeboaphelidium occidentale]|nr:hypothetical protein MP638_006076 [Amoeboaphelidium occidentale]